MAFRRKPARVLWQQGAAGRPLTFIGRFTVEPVVRIRLETGQDWAPAKGYDHFAK